MPNSRPDDWTARVTTNGERRSNSSLKYNNFVSMCWLLIVCKHLDRCADGETRLEAVLPMTEALGKLLVDGDGNEANFQIIEEVLVKLIDQLPDCFPGCVQVNLLDFTSTLISTLAHEHNLQPKD